MSNTNPAGRPQVTIRLGDEAFREICLRGGAQKGGKESFSRYFALLALSRDGMRNALTNVQAKILLEAIGSFKFEWHNIHLLYVNVSVGIADRQLDIKYEAADIQELTTVLRSLSPAHRFALADAIEQWRIGNKEAFEGICGKNENTKTSTTQEPDRAADEVAKRPGNSPGQNGVSSACEASVA